jgi:hypothetical protein
VSEPLRSRRELAGINKYRPARCVVCGEPIYPDAQTCKECGAYQHGKNCRACGRWIPLAASRCGECTAHQTWWWRFPVNATAVTSLISLLTLIGTLCIGLVNFLSRPSRTTAMLLPNAKDERVSKDKEILIIRALNRGKLPSVIRRVTLDLRNVKATPVVLDITNFDGEIPGNGHFDLRLFADDIKPAISKEEVAARLCSADVVFRLDVLETDVWGSMQPPKRPLEIPVSGTRLRQWVLDRLGGEFPPC